MDDKTLASLRTALDASPENLELRMILAGAYHEHDDTETAHDLVKGLKAGDELDDESRRLVARIYLAAGAGTEALVWIADDDTGEALLVKANAHLALDQRDEGLRAYRAAVAANPALEDMALRDRLTSRVRTFPSRTDDDGGGRPQLRVISNDDTDQSEVNRLLMPREEKVTFGDVGGLEAIKKQIRKRIILPFQKPALFQRFKKRIGGGLLLYGPPGCGKTLLARATAGECDANFYNVAISDVLDMYIGESERKLHALFDQARSASPSVLFFDEIEALGGKRQYTREVTASKLVSQFLAEMDGFTQENSGVLILGATNVPWAVDPAFRRPGRFDRLLFVPPADTEARRAILEILLADRPVAAKIDLGFLVKRTSGFSGADLRNLVETAADEAIEASLEKGEEVPIGDTELRAALTEVKATTLEWLTTARNYARYANEAGQYDEVLQFLDKHSKKGR
jgi:transitional endoplasmic reticulum ATPase